ncbi:MAG TPA: tyrosine-type recombinase/integrase, partial [Longimicrobiaceae bacterium]|nr:tyrosine-type recombinase/integrase [Longimicrobiaceae bacterium]
LSAYPVEAGEFVFRNPRTNGVWTARALQEDFKALCARAKVTYGRQVGGKTIHTLRHTCGTNLVKAGVNLKIIADLLGDTPEVAARTYLHPDRRDVTAGIEAGLRHQALQLAALDRAAGTAPVAGAVDGCPQ